MTHRHRVLVVAVAVLTLSGGSLAAGATSTTQTVDAVPSILVSGEGFGHGVGMPQDGALALGRQGWSASQILSHFYPGTELSSFGVIDIHVPVLTEVDSVRLTLPGGGTLRSPREGPQARGFPISVEPGQTVTVTRVGSNQSVSGGTPASEVVAVAAEDASTTTLPGASSTSSSTTTPPPATTTTSPPTSTSTTTTTSTSPTTSTTQGPATPTTGRSVWVVDPGDGVALPDLDRAFRGSAEIQVTESGLRVVNIVDVEQYLRGMGEVRDGSWPPAALEAQAVAARSYAVWKQSTSGEVCPTVQCQVYLGRHAEYAAMDAAVAATAGQVVRHRGAVIQALYSANAAGHAASVHEGFGPSANDVPYLTAVEYPSPDPMPWDRIIQAAELTAELGITGEVLGVAVTRRGPSNRPLEVVITTSEGDHPVTGKEFVDALSLRSTLYDVHTVSPGSTVVAGPIDANSPPPGRRLPLVASPSAFIGPASTSPGLGRAPWLATALVMVVSAGLATHVVDRARRGMGQRR